MYLSNNIEQFIEGDDRIIIMIHGFTGSPYSFYFMIRYFKELKYTIYAPLLLGHDSDENFKKYIAFEWYEDLKGRIKKKLLSKKYREIHVVGLSMGGAFSIKLVNELKQFNITTLTLLATPYKLKFKQQFLLHTLGYTFLEIFHSYHKKKPSDIKNSLQQMINSNFKEIPIRSVFGLSYFLKEVKPLIKEITIPTLVVHSKRDHTIPWKQSRYFFKKLKTKHKKRVLLKKSYHILPLDIEKEYLFNVMESFIKKFI